MRFYKRNKKILKKLTVKNYLPVGHGTVGKLFYMIKVTKIIDSQFFLFFHISFKVYYSAFAWTEGSPFRPNTDPHFPPREALRVE